MQRLGYRPWLDGLRGIAISAVFVNHLQFLIYQGRPLFGWLFLPFGMLGVDVFFVLSGFLITTLLLEEQQNTDRISLKKFYTRRALRLLPALIVLLVCMVVYSKLFLSAQEANSTALLSGIALVYCTNWFFAFGVNSDLLGHLWSLAVEEQFYLIWPFVLSLILQTRLAKRSTFLFMLGLIVLVCFHRVLLVSTSSPARVYFGSDTRADSLLIGCIVAMVVSWRLLPRWSLRGLKWAGALSILVIAAYVADLFNLGRTLYSTGFTVFAIAVGIFILQVMIEPSRLVSILEWPGLVWLGKLSYSLYLWHFFTIGITVLFPMPNAVRVALSILISLAVASASYYLIERPFLKLKSRYANTAEVCSVDAKPRLQSVVGVS
jgi:peptidoglycan/LPS O-acetylase OafA/YrhL